MIAKLLNMFWEIQREESRSINKRGRREGGREGGRDGGREGRREGRKGEQLQYMYM